MLNIKNAVSLVAIIAAGSFALACSGADTGSTAGKTGESAGNLAGSGGSGGTTSSSGSTTAGGSGSSSTPGATAGDPGPGSTPGCGTTGDDAGVTGGPITDDDGGFGLCDPSECPGVIPQVAAICASGEAAEYVCYRQNGAACTWTPFCGL